MFFQSPTPPPSGGGLSDSQLVTKKKMGITLAGNMVEKIMVNHQQMF